MHLKILRILIYNLGFILFAFNTMAATRGAHKACVISFLNRYHIFHELTDLTLKQYNQGNVIFLKEALPVALIQCLKQGATEITIIAHTAKVIDNENMTNLLYFSQSKLQPIASRPFENFAKELRKQHPRQFKRLRMITCFGEKVLRRYDLIRLSKEFGFTIQLSDPSKFAQALAGFQDVATLDYRWLAESFQDIDNQGRGSPKNIFFYVHTNTFLVYQFGQEEVLQGRFSVEVDGLALGLEEKWRMFWVPRRELLSIKVGETKTIWIDTFGVSMNLGILGMEVQVKGRDPIQSPLGQSDPDALGAAIGLKARLTITRNY